MAQSKSSNDIVWDDEAPDAGVVWDEPAAQPSRFSRALSDLRDYYKSTLAGQFRANAVAGRGAIEGMAGTANYVADLANRATNDLGLTQTPEQDLPSARFQRLLTQAGLPEARDGGQTIAGIIGKGLGMAADPAGAFVAERPQQLPGRVQPSTLARQEGLQAGLKVTPQYAPDTPFGNVLESVSYPSKLRTQASAANDTRFAELVRAANGMPEGTQLTGDALDAVVKKAIDTGYTPLAQANLPIRTARGLGQQLQRIIENTAGVPGSPTFREDIARTLEQFDQPQYTSRTLLDGIRQLRQMASDAFRGAQPDAAAGRAYRGAADALENTLDAGLQLAGQGRTHLARYRQARQSIAIAEATRDALVPGTGRIDAGKLADMIDERPLTGNLALIARFAANHPAISRVPLQGEPELMSTPQLGLGISQVGAAFQGLGAPFRKFLLSDAYQSALRNAPEQAPESLRRFAFVSPIQAYYGLYGTGGSE